MRKKFGKNQPKIAFQGAHGAYSEIAARHIMKNAVCVPVHATEDVMKAVAQKKVSHGIVMLENSTEGTLHYTYDLLAAHRLAITGELYLRIHHALLGIPTGKKGMARLTQLRRVYSHPQALAECAAFFKQHQWIETVSAYDTAGMAQEVARHRLPEESAVASARAASLYGLEVLADRIETKHENYVRFGLMSRKGKAKPIKGNKVSLMLTLAHTPGSLSRFLVQCAGRGMNLTKVESRPLLSHHDEYLFYVDFEHAFSPEVLTRTLEALESETTSFLLLGSYLGGNVHRLIDS